MAFNISGTNAYKNSQSKTAMYESLISRAERTNRENNGKPSKAEAQLYVQAMDVCAEIKNANLSQRGIVAKWEQNRIYCEQKARELLMAMGAVIHEPQGAAAGPVEPNGRLNAVINTQSDPQKSSKATAKEKTQTTTPDGFTTKNACKEVPAETIAKWYRQKPDDTLEDLVGADDLVKQLIRVAGDMGFSKTDELLHIAPEKGILLYGFHGNGKTTMIRAFVNYLMNKDDKIRFMQLAGSDIHASLVGVAEKTVSIAFQEAIDNAAEAPCVLFFDEIDDICVSRSGTNEGHVKRLTDAFLEGYNNLVKAGVPVVVMAATNNPWLVDAAVCSRFTTKIMVPLPCEASRQSFMEHMFNMIQLEDDLTCEDIADDTDNFDFRDLKGMALLLAGNLKEAAKNYVKATYPDVEDLDAKVADVLMNGEVRLTRDIYDEVRPQCHATLTQEERRQMEEYTASLAAME